MRLSRDRFTFSATTIIFLNDATSHGILMRIVLTRLSEKTFHERQMSHETKMFARESHETVMRNKNLPFLVGLTRDETLPMIHFS